MMTKTPKERAQEILNKWPCIHIECDEEELAKDIEESLEQAEATLLKLIAEKDARILDLCQQHGADEETIHGLEDLLEETVDWLCDHPGAEPHLLAHAGMRYWCIECSNYVRSLDQACLKERIRERLKGGK